MDGPKTKIAIISQSLGGGGAERFAGLLGFILDELGFEVHNIILNEPQDYDYCGALLNLGAIYKEAPEWKRKIFKMNALSKYLNEHQIGTIIDNRTRSQFFRELATKWVYGDRKAYYLIHNYKLDNYLQDNVLLAKWLFGNAQKFICVSNAIEEKVKAKYHFKNTVTVYNPIDLDADLINTATDIPPNFILYFGRFDEKAKNFTLLLDAFSTSEIYKKGYLLLLMGEGPDEVFIKAEISRRDLDAAVQIIPYRSNPFGVVKNAHYTVLSSRFEGFPMSVVESLAVGTPVIAVDCNSGPREVIVNEKNGLLVENYNPDQLAKAMRRLIDDNALYQRCKENASASVSHLSMQKIAAQWNSILKNQ